MSATKAPPHVVLLACPGGGHVLPMAEFARRLALDHGFTATVITYSSLSVPTQMHFAVLASLPASVTTAALPDVPLDDLPADARIETRMLTAVARAMPHLRALLADLVRERISGAQGGGVVAFLADMFCSQALPIAADLGVPAYIVYLSNLMLLSLMLHLPELDGATACEYRDLPEPLRLPGCVPLCGADLLDTIQDRSNPAYALMAEMTRHFVLADGFVVNTFDGMEHDAITAFQELSGKGVCPPVYPVGPFVRPCFDDATAQHGCLQWLDGHPDGSVLYVCFGSGGTLSVEQTDELAAGLEACGQRFLWVMQFPSDKDGSGAYLDAAVRGDPLSFLPEGFTERTKGVGLCVPHWAPQVEVLHHRAVGGFLSHCGWNSTLEAVNVGVPMLAWPLFAEHRMNAVMLEEKVGMALCPASARDGDGRRVVRREEVAAVVRELMAGEKGEVARKKAMDMKKAAAEALAPEGPSRKVLAAIVSKWKGAREQLLYSRLQSAAATARGPERLWSPRGSGCSRLQRTPTEGAHGGAGNESSS